MDTPEARRCAYGPPRRVWYRTSDGWASREWKQGESLAYAREVLGHAPKKEPEK